MRPLEPGWTHIQPTTVIDPDTGNARAGLPRTAAIRATLQEVTRGGDRTEFSARDVSDERGLIIRPPRSVLETDEFLAPDGTVWLAIGGGRSRHRPGRKPAYTLVGVRRAKEKETQ